MSSEQLRRRHGGSAEPAPEAAGAPPAKKTRSRRCGTCMLRTVLGCAALILVSAFAALVAHNGSVASLSVSVNFAMMSFFRDLSRAKARRRRFGQKGALMPILMGREEPLPLADASLGLALTLDELAEFDGRDLPDSTEMAPLFLAIHGRIYDVTAGGPFYGPGRSYHKLVGKDATRAFCTGCLEPACLISSTRGLTPKQLKEADRWIELYEHHDKYKLVGTVRGELTIVPAASTLGPCLRPLLNRRPPNIEALCSHSRANRAERC